MSEFSDKCKAYIEKSNTNVYQIAKKSGLDRTMLQKMVKGTKVPSPTFFEKFCEYLVINKAEKNELEQLFKIERIGKDVYSRRCEISRLLSDFRNLKATTRDKLPEKWFNISERLEVALLNQEDVKLSTEVDLIDTMRFMIREAYDTCDHPQVYLDMFDAAPFALNEIYRCSQRGEKDLHCIQFVKFGRSNPSHNATVENIRVLRMIMPFASKFDQKYDVYYSYINGNRYDGNFNIWAHYVVTQSRVLLISEKGDEGLLISNREIAKSYIERMENMKEGCDVLFDVYEQDCNSLSFQQRFEMFENYCHGMEDKRHRKVVKRPVQMLEKGLIVELFEPNYVVFGSVHTDFPFGIICIKETELYEAFQDYYNSLENEDSIPLAVEC